MPIYEYDCKGCGERFELLVRSDTVPACPRCGGAELKKLLSSFALNVVGSSYSRSTDAGPCGSCGHPDGPGACRSSA